MIGPRLLTLACLLSALAACDSTLNTVDGPAPPSLALYGGQVTAVGPDGYCVDRQSSRPWDGFALMTGCARLDVEADGFAFGTPVLTLQMGQRSSAAVVGQEDALAALMETPETASDLLGPGADVVDITRSDGLVIVEVRLSEAPGPGLGLEEWRAFFDLDGRLATLAVRETAAAPLAPQRGVALARDAVAALRAANAAP